MNDRPIPKKGQKYKHFKGGVYEILAISTPSPSNTKMIEMHLGRHSETDNEVRVWFFDNDSAVVSEDPLYIYKEPLVVYAKSRHDRLWVRPLDNFLEVLSDDNQSNYYRFTLMEVESDTK